MKNRSPIPVDLTRATSRVRTLFCRITSFAPSGFSGTARVAARSLPVPLGRRPRVTLSGNPACPSPLITSLMVPSPPATRSSPSRHSRAASTASSLLPVSTQSGSKLPSVSRNRSVSHVPPPEDGLQITLTSVFETSIYCPSLASASPESLPRTTPRYGGGHVARRPVARNCARPPVPELPPGRAGGDGQTATRPQIRARRQALPRRGLLPRRRSGPLLDRRASQPSPRWRDRGGTPLSRLRRRRARASARDARPHHGGRRRECPRCDRGLPG